MENTPEKLTPVFLRVTTSDDEVRYIDLSRVVRFEDDDDEDEEETYTRVFVREVDDTEGEYFVDDMQVDEVVRKLAQQNVIKALDLKK
jgi:hypothetical protein